MQQDKYYLRNDSAKQFPADVERHSFPHLLEGKAQCGADTRRNADEPQLPADRALAERVNNLERQNRYIRMMFLATLMLVAYLGTSQMAPKSATTQKVLTQSDEIKLLDSSGTTRLYVRMYSQEPILQLMDSVGNPRLSLGIRFDDTPFIDLYDRAGRTRATFQMSEEDEPTLRLYDEQGEPSFTIN